MIDRALVRDLAAAACFAAFAFGAFLSAPRRGDPGRSRKRRASVFALWTLVVSLGIGVTEKDLYPFTSWALIAWLYPESVWYSRFLAVDAAGGEHEVDYRAWQPLSVDELASWIGNNFLTLDSAGRDEAARDLLQRANAAARRVQAGARPGSFDRFLGPLSAPLFHLHPAPWTGPATLPPMPFVGLRVYTESWDPDERARDPSRVTRRLLYEYRDAP